MHESSPRHYTASLGVLLAILLLLVWAIPSTARPACHTYSNSAVSIDSNGVYCGNTGSGCTECVTFGGFPGGLTTCWSNGLSTICGNPITGYFLL